MQKLIILENKAIKISEELLRNNALPVWLFWAYCFFLLEPQIKDRKYSTVLRDRMIGNRLAKYRKKKKLKELNIKLP
jgi:hypothetical protein